MTFQLKDMYNYLLSHTFPGLLLGVEIILAFYWFTNLPVDVFIVKICKTNPTLLIIIGYALSTLLGFIIDGLHHYFYEDIQDTKWYEDHFGKNHNEISSKPINCQSKNKFISLKDSDKFYIYTHFVEDDYYYPYEAYANTSIAMSFGLVLLIMLICIGRSCNVLISTSTYIFLLVLTPVYIFILCIMIYEAIITLKDCEDEEDQFNAAYKSNENRED
jgi:hypothetical protein